MKKPIKTILPSAILTCLTLAALLAIPSFAQKPNIIYIMTDDMGYADLSCYGQKKYQTPNLDKLAAQGVKFVNAYSAGAVCTPTRTAIMTGRYPSRTPVGLLEPIKNVKKDSVYGLTADYPSLPSLLKRAGYETVLIGKWHLGFLPEHSPVKNGFDYFFGIHSGASDYIAHAAQGVPDLFENDSLVEVEGYLTEIFAEKAAGFIRQEHSKPFFLMVTFNAPHWPWQAPGDKPYPDSLWFRKGGSPETYAAMMKSLDEGVGTIMQAVEAMSLSEETLVIFTNDNGGERFSDHGGLAKSKGSLWEGGIKVPAFARWTGKLPSGEISRQVVVTMDWTATILAAADVQPDADFPLDGINLMPIMTGSEPPVEREIYWRTYQHSSQQAMRSGQWKYLQDDQGEYLFNIETDQFERQNLKAVQPELFNQLKSKYNLWQEQVLKPIPL